MTSPFAVVERTLGRVEFRWKLLRLLQRTFQLGSIVCLFLLFFGAALLLGWINSKPLASAVYALAAVAGFLVWVALIVRIAAGVPERPWLAAAIERKDRRLLDRLNTLLFLQRPDSHVEAPKSFSTRIAAQTRRVIEEKRPPSPFSPARPLVQLVTFLIALGATLAFYELYSPWDRLIAAEDGKNRPPVAPAKQSELAMPATNNIEQKQPWGEVRIVDPGGDLKMTKVDVVPLQIEAAANRSLDQISWFSAVNGAKETAHPLPRPADPRYAVYQPSIYLDEMSLSDWDVLTYYAKATAGKQNSYASDIYFIEVRPFREDILKMPGGEGGKPYRTLNEMSTLISRQQHVIRQTHQHVQKPPEQETLESQDRKKLSDAEDDLSAATKHLYAKMASEMENKPIGTALDNLAQAEKSLADSSHSLQDKHMSEAQGHERDALLQLVAARKTFQKAVSDHPSNFDSPPNGNDDPPPATAEASKKLNKMAEFRDEAKAAQESVKKTLEQQKELELQSKIAPRSKYSGLADQEQQLQKGLDDFEQQHPRVFKGAEAESKQAQQAMSQAAESFRKQDAAPTEAAGQATRQLQKLNDALQARAAQQQLADAYKLKQMLEKQIRALDQQAKTGKELSNEQLQQTATDARETVNQLKKTAEQEPTRQAFGQPLRDALSNENKADIESKLDRLTSPRGLDEAQDQAAQQQRASEARDALNQVNQAFAASEPKATQTAQKTDSLKPSGQDSMGQGMAKLDSLVKQAQSPHPPSAQDQAKQARQALQDLQAGLSAVQGDSQRGQQLLGQIGQMLKSETSPDSASLKTLLEELQRFSFENSKELAKKEEKPNLANIDPSRLPPAYRGRIQKYFQKLSE